MTRSQKAREETLQRRAVQRLLVVEVVIEQRLVDAGGFGDGIDARAGQAFLGELRQRGLRMALRLASGWRRLPRGGIGFVDGGFI